MVVGVVNVVVNVPFKAGEEWVEDPQVRGRRMS